MRKFDDTRQQSEFEEKVLEIDRISRTVKGGRRIRFRALVIIGDRKGRVGFGVAKASEVVVAIGKAKEYAQKHIVKVSIYKDTIPYQIRCTFGSSEIILKPAPEGTSLLAGGSVRSLLDLAGYKNIVAKSLGSNNKINVVTATLNGLASFKPAEEKVSPAIKENPKPIEEKSAKKSTEKPKKEIKNTKKEVKEVKK